MLYGSPKVSFVRSGDGSAKAVYLEADRIGQHEAGMQDLNYLLGIGNEEIDGLGRYTVTNRTTPYGDAMFKTFEQKVRTWVNGRRKTIKVLALAVVDPHWKDDHRPELYRDEPDLAGEFNRENVVVFARSAEGKAMLRLIEEHAAKGDVAVYWHTGENPFHRGGIMISIPSLIEQEYLDDIFKQHVEEKRLSAAAIKTGIADRIKTWHQANSRTGWGRGYHALAPAWASFFKGPIASRGPEPWDPSSTGYDVIFYLNPQDQERFNHGWFTVEELDAWLEGKGPVLKSQPAAA